MFFCRNSLVGRDGYHGVNVLNGASSGKVVDRTCYALEDRADGFGMSQTLYQFIGDVADFKIGNNQNVGMSGDFGTRSFAFAYARYKCGISNNPQKASGRNPQKASARTK